jgi:hypothetical protein
MGEKLDKALCRKAMNRVTRYMALVKFQAPAAIIERELVMIRETHSELSLPDFIYCLMNFEAFRKENAESQKEQQRAEEEYLDSLTPEDILGMGDELDEE